MYIFTYYIYLYIDIYNPNIFNNDTNYRHKSEKPGSDMGSHTELE